MFGIGGIEFVLILVFGFIIFGPDKLPEIAKTVAQAINKFRGAQDKMNDVIKTEVFDPKSDEPFKNPLDVVEKASKAVSGKSEETDAKSADEKDASSEKKTEPKAEPKEKESGGKESIAERKAKYAAKKETEEEQPASSREKTPAKKTVKRAPAKPKTNDEKEAK